MFHLLKPQDIGDKKIRLGPPGLGQHGDGGYVCPLFMLEKSTCLVTYGVGGDTRYEHDYTKKYNKQAYLFDPNVDHPDKDGEFVNFKKEGLGQGMVNNRPCKEFVEHYNELGLKGDVLLKIDTEGAEYDYFNTADISEIAKRCTGIILEIHWLDDIPHRNKAEIMLNRLKEYFVLCHTHANNWGNTFDYIQKASGSKFIGYTIPRVFELTFANKRYVNSITPDLQQYPIIGLDMQNNVNDPDCDLSFLNDF